MLDKLFSREIERRTGAHAINIYIESTVNARRRRKRSRSIGANALKSTQHTKVITKHSQGSFLHHLDVRFPWLKLAAVCILGLIIMLDLLDFTISRTTDPANLAITAPMAKHVHATERTLEGKMLVALTFDDGPSPATTPALLDALAAKDAPATFFTLGYMVRDNPDLVKRAKAEHHEIASHTMYHQNLITLPAASVQADINEANATLGGIIGQGPAYTRPPYGNVNDSVRAYVGTPIILWSVDTRDWQDKDVGAIINTTMSQVHDGAIILMHDIYPTSVEAVPALIDTLRQAGYELATVSELAQARKVSLTPGATYYNFRP